MFTASGVYDHRSLILIQILSDVKCVWLHLVSSSFSSFKMLHDTHSEHL